MKSEKSKLIYCTVIHHLWPQSFILKLQFKDKIKVIWHFYCSWYENITVAIENRI